MSHPSCYQFSHCQPMNRENLRKLKHEIRTPVNHILGYSELLMESATDAGDDRMAELAQDIHRRGQLLASTLEKNLLVSSADTDADLMIPLRDSVSPTIREIVTIAFLSPDSPGVSSYREDLGRIRDAATQLMLLIQPDRSPNSD